MSAPSEASLLKAATEFYPRNPKAVLKAVLDMPNSTLGRDIFAKARKLDHGQEAQG